MRQIALLAFFALVVGPNWAYALNIARNHVTGEILELDDASVDRFVDEGSTQYDADVTTGTYSGPVPELPLKQCKFDPETGTVVEKSTEEKAVLERQGKAKATLARKKKRVALDEIERTETDPDVLEEISKEKAALDFELIKSSFPDEGPR